MVIAFLVVFGLIFGSFINALVFRMHDQQTGGKLSITKGRSVCSNCRHQLVAKDLVPLFSWLWLRGKCRYCHKSIQDSPLVEIVLPLLFVVSYLAWPQPLIGQEWLLLGVWLAFLVVGVALAVYDLRWFLLPNVMVAWLVVLAVVYSLVSYFAGNVGAGDLLSSGLASGLLAGIFYALFALSKGQLIGGGDVKLAVGLGLLAGSPIKSMLLLFAASLIGTFWSLPLVAKGGGLKAKIPFGPFLLLGTYVVFFWGQMFLDWLG